MSELKTNKISTNDQNNVAIDNALGLKSYTTTQRNALSSPQAGDTIYNSTTGTIDFYNGSGWFSTSDSTFTFSMQYLIIAGGGAGANWNGGGGAGGYRNSYASETSGQNSSTEAVLSTPKDGTSITVTVGAGGAAGSSSASSSPGNNLSLIHI